MPKSLQELQTIAKKVHREIIEMTAASGASGRRHLAARASMASVTAAVNSETALPTTGFWSAGRSLIDCLARLATELLPISALRTSSSASTDSAASTAAAARPGRGRAAGQQAWRGRSWAFGV